LPVFPGDFQYPRRDSNPQPSDPKSDGTTHTLLVVQLSRLDAVVSVESVDESVD
jgi:hypothetical protein